MTLRHRMRGGAIGVVLTLLALTAVAVVVFFAVDRFLLDSANLKRMTGQSTSLFATARDEGDISAAEATRIGREEAERVAARIASQAARQAARDTIVERTDGQASTPPPDLPAEPDINTLSGPQQIAAREARRVAQRIADQIARDVATDELMAYVDSVTDFSAASTEPAEQQPVSQPEPIAEDTEQTEDTTLVMAESEARQTAAPAAAATSDATSPARSTGTAPKPIRPAQQAPVPVRTAPKPSALDFKPWWPTAGNVPENALSLRFAGEAQGEAHGVALLFTEAPASLDAVASHVRVLNDAGNTVRVTWSSGRNPALVQTGPLPVGRYVVIIADDLTSRSGKTMVRKLEGPVFVAAD